MQPEQMGPYKLGARLGRGGMGAVYEATDTGTGAAVAVKVLAAHLADDSSLRKRFESEIETLKSLRHPGIVQLLAFGEEDDQPYFAMELVRGKSLEQLLRAGRRFTWQETVAVGLAVARALKVAHDHGIIHRDIKPANLLIPTAAVETPDGAGAAQLSEVKLADFGIARLFGASGHTAHGHIVGTAEYMAPEQAAGKPLDHRADLYALGLVMFAMLVGRPPFQSKQVTEVIDRQRREPAPRVATLAADVPPELDALIDKLLAKDPAARPANALALGRLLSAVDASQTPPPAAAPPAAPPQPAAATAHARSEGKTVAGTETRSTESRASSIDHFAATRPHTAPASPAESMPDGDIIWAQPAVTAPVDAVSATQPFTGNNPAFTTKLAARTAEPEGSQSGSAGSQTVVDRRDRNRFTTVAELDKAAREREERARTRQWLWQSLTAVLTIAALGGGGYLLFRSLSADELYARIKAIEVAAGADGGDTDLRDARPSIDLFLERHPDDPRAAEVRRIDESLDLDALEKRARRRVLGNRVPGPIERDYRAAMQREGESPSACRDALVALTTLHAPSVEKPAADSEEASPPDDERLWLALARRQIDRLAPLAAREEAEDGKRIAAAFAEADALSARAAALPDPAQREAVIAQRRTLLEGLIELYSDRPHAAQAVATAKQKLSPSQQETVDSP
jgi:serine/threonine protein kinase